MVFDLLNFEAQPMADPTSSLTSPRSSQTGPLKCLLGALIASAFTYGLYRLTSAIALSFASKPLQSSSSTAMTISVAVRTLVVGLAALGTGIFGIACLGLLALAVQLTLQRLFAPKAPPPSSFEP
jgi:hypothetical protein